MVNVIFLGTGGWVTSPYRKFQCIFIQNDDDVLVLECGAFTSEQFSIYKPLLDKVKAIVITHMHGDHVSGLPSLLFYMKFSGFSGTIDILTPQQYLEFLGDMCDQYIKAAPFEVTMREIKAPQTYHVASYTISFYEVEHSVYNVGCKIKVGDKVIGYSSDTRLCRGLETIAQNADLLICEASFTTSMREKAYEVGHLTPYDALIIFKKAKAKQLVLSHIGFEPYLETTNFEGHPVIWASDNMIITL